MSTDTRWAPAVLLALLPAGLSGVAAAEERTIEEVVVTGSRIARDAGTYVGPMTVLGGDAIRTNPNYSLNDQLLQLPSIGAQGTNRNVANGGRGANFTDIHQLEPERTLVLYNGRRTVSTIRDSLGLGVDLQSFPVNLIDRVEVLADGASTVYGSDAVAGVINLIPRSDIEGLELSVGGSTPEDPGGDHFDAGLLFGLRGERGFFNAGITYVFDGDVDYQDRDFAKIPLLGTQVADGQELNLVGSGIPPQGIAGEAGIIFEPNPETGESFQVLDPFCLGDGPGSDGSGSVECILRMNQRFNYNDIDTGVSLINENRNVNFSGIGEYEFDNATGYVMTTLSHREGRMNFTPLPVQGAAGRFTDLIQVPFTNPNIPADALPVLLAARAETCAAIPDPDEQAVCLANPNFQMTWRGLDLGPRTFDYDSDTISGTIGLRGDLELAGRPWEWDTWFTVGRSDLYEVTHGQLNVARLQTALDPALCALDAACPKDADGNPTLDIFGRSPKSPEEIAYLTFDDQERTQYDMLHLAATLTGELVDLPAGAVGVAVGVEYREEKGAVDTSGVVQAGDSGGNFAEPTSGKYDVKEIYAEFSLPLLADAPAAEELTLDLAGRYSDYDTFGSEFTYKFALGWSPVEQLRFRGTYATGYRAPNVLELFGGTADTFQTVTDPCTAPVTDPIVRANCDAAGVPADFVQPAAQLKISAGGNPDLDAETSESFSIGLVWQPDFAPLRIALDWYDVEVEDAVGTPDPVDVITACYTSPDGALSAPECERIGRGPDNSVVRFDLLNENLATIETSGIDLDATYTLSTGLGQIQIDWLLNYLDEYKETTTSGVVSDRTGMVAGLVSDWAAYPEFRSNLGITLLRDQWSVGLTYRYLDEMDVFDAIGFDTVHTTADAQHYLDLQGSYDVGAWSFQAGVENLTDEEPPYVPDTSANTSGIYDFLGRVFYARASVSFR
ncbi:MAG TPA: TonB-dependent receptor [Pseudomonadales bacterium]